jgi:pyridoxamine 5'-phosphate oxidase family protein
MSHFLPQEIAYLESQQLGRLATVNAAGDPHVVPVSYRYNVQLDTIDIGGYRNGTTKKFRDVLGDGRVAFLVDDVVPPWKPRFIEVRGRAEALHEGGQSVNANFDPTLIRIHPARIVSSADVNGGETTSSRTVR